MGSAASPFIIDDAIVGLAQPLTEALNQLASGLWVACDVIEELGRREEFYVNLAGSSSGCTAGAVFENAHLSDKLPRANRAEEDRVTVEFPEYLDDQHCLFRVRWRAREIGPANLWPRGLRGD